MPSYTVTIPFSGSVKIAVKAHNEDAALEKALNYDWDLELVGRDKDKIFMYEVEHEDSEAEVDEED